MVCLSSTVLYKVVLTQALLLYCVTPIWRGAKPLPDQLPGEHTGVQATHSAQWPWIICLHSHTFNNIPHPRQVRGTVDWACSYGPCTCSFLCSLVTYGMTVNNPGLFMSWEPLLRKPFICSSQTGISTSGCRTQQWHDMVTYQTDLAMAPVSMVIHPRTEWAQWLLNFSDQPWNVCT